jgi:apolipoprotein N-acyltransferase
VIQIAELAGVYGVSFVIALVSAALAAAIGLGGRRAGALVGAAGVVLAGSLGFGWLVLRGPDHAPPGGVRVGIVQPSIEQTLKWDPAYHAQILDTYEALTRQVAASRPAVILWPETATTIFLREDRPLLERLVRLAGELETPLLIGSIDREDGSAGTFLNSAFLLTGQGITGKYDKIHLVPFGEYVPLGWLLGWVKGWAEFISDFGVGEVETVFRLREGDRFGTVICYEVIFPELFRGFVAGGADFMANITNDAWFGQTSGPWQHLGMLPLRAVEHRVAIARAANTGISALVDQSGRVARWLPLFERGVLDGRLSRRTRTTLYTRWGDWLPYGSLGVSALVFALALSRGSRGTDAR